MFKPLVLIAATCLQLCHGAAVHNPPGSSLTAALIRAPPALWSEPILSRVYNGVDINATTDLGVKYIKQAAKQGANLVAFPELWFPGYPRGNDDAWIEKWAADYVENSITVGDANWKKLISAAQKNSVYLALAFSERVKDAIYMAQAFIDPKGEVLIHRHKLRPSGGERNIWSDGTTKGFKVVNTTYGRIGMLECWEHFHPAMTFPMQAQDEAIHIAAWPYTPDYNDPAAVFFETAEVNMAAASVYATSSGAYTLVPTVGRAAAFGPDGLEIASLPAYLPAEAAPFLMITINTTGFADRPAYDVDSQQSWGVLAEIRAGWPKDVPKVAGTFTDRVFNNSLSPEPNAGSASHPDSESIRPSSHVQPSNAGTTTKPPATLLMTPGMESPASGSVEDIRPAKPDAAKRVSEQDYIASLQRQVRELQQVVKDFDQHRVATSHVQSASSVTELTPSRVQVVHTNRPGSSSPSPSGAAWCPNDGSVLDEANAGQHANVEEMADSINVVAPGDFIINAQEQRNANEQRVEHHGLAHVLDVPEEASGPSPVSAMGATTSVRDQTATLQNDEFYGRSSVLSLLQEVPHSSSHLSRGRMAPPQTRTTPRRSEHHRAIVQSPPNAMLQPEYALPPREVADQLVQSYFSNVHIFYPWTHSIAFRSQYEALWTSAEQQASNTDQKPDIGLGGRNCPRPVFFCVINAVFALGCEFSSFPSEEKEAASAVFYGRMKDLLHFQLLDHSSISHVQALLVAAKYLFCTQYPTRCYNVVGLAFRMAIGLGLHSVGFSQRHSQVETEIRRRVWTVSMTLGRPPSMQVVSDVPLPNAIDDEYLQLHGDSSQQPQQTPSKNLFMVENIKLAKILALILDRIYGFVSVEKNCCRANHTSFTNDQDFGTLTHLDSLLEGIRSGLPEALRWDPDAKQPAGRSPLLERQSNVLYARFLHLKILLYRPGFSDFYLVTCGIVLVLGESTDTGNGVFNQDDIGLAWESCIETLTYMSNRHIRAGDYLRLLQSLRQKAKTDRAATQAIPHVSSNGAHS
ncbi:hypothetical protein AK830_g420 [Neonectria ditissima]|uniref:CN hydrolase domain-containing protein n=1 Tax=Neonectria ditissima TaxID=78410 RepID=A0A0P7C288_9HYPO|nr:hypothetical protein AK830_g420 [Neonectria ditissima]